MSKLRWIKNAQINHFQTSDVVIIFLILVPLIVISVIGIRSLHTENALAQQRQIERNLWVAKGIESTIKLYIDDQMMPYVDWVNQHASQFEEMRMWTFNRIELDLVT
ncbi:MAG: hypothetical protein AAGJ37_17520, partial [Pseudomonadota bacterium]